jgi:hypothetical protein
MLCLALAFVPGCAHKPVTIDERPRPPQPPPASSTSDTTHAVVPTQPTQPTPSGSESLHSLAVADTVAANEALQRCAGKKLLPDEESTADAVASTLAQARAAMLRGDMKQARSLARNARQLSSSLTCQ